MCWRGKATDGIDNSNVDRWWVNCDLKGSLVLTLKLSKNSSILFWKECWIWFSHHAYFCECWYQRKNCFSLAAVNKAWKTGTHSAVLFRSSFYYRLSHCQIFRSQLSRSIPIYSLPMLLIWIKQYCLHNRENFDSFLFLYM